MNREHAIKIISSLKCQNLSREDRELIINNSWGFNEGDEEISLLSIDLREELLHYDAPQEDIMSSKYDRLVEVACELSYSQLSNEKLQVMVTEILKKPVTVEGIVSTPILFIAHAAEKQHFRVGVNMIFVQSVIGRMMEMMMKTNIVHRII